MYSIKSLGMWFSSWAGWSSSGHCSLFHPALCPLQEMSKEQFCPHPTAPVPTPHSLVLTPHSSGFPCFQQLQCEFSSLIRDLSRLEKTFGITESNHQAQAAALSTGPWSPLQPCHPAGRALLSLRPNWLVWLSFCIVNCCGAPAMKIYTKELFQELLSLLLLARACGVWWCPGASPPCCRRAAPALQSSRPESTRKGTQGWVLWPSWTKMKGWTRLGAAWGSGRAGMRGALSPFQPKPLCDSTVFPCK